MFIDFNNITHNDNNNDTNLRHLCNLVNNMPDTVLIVLTCFILFSLRHNSLIYTYIAYLHSPNGRTEIYRTKVACSRSPRQASEKKSQDSNQEPMLLTLYHTSSSLTLCVISFPVNTIFILHRTQRQGHMLIVKSSEKCGPFVSVWMCVCVHTGESYPHLHTCACQSAFCVKLEFVIEFQSFL